MRLAARLLEAEQACSSLTCYFLSSVVLLCPCLCPWHRGCWGGRQGPGVALSGVVPYAHSGCVAAQLQLAECLEFVCLCVAPACRHLLSRCPPIAYRNTPIRIPRSAFGVDCGPMGALIFSSGLGSHSRWFTPGKGSLATSQLTYLLALCRRRRRARRKPRT